MPSFVLLIKETSHEDLFPNTAWSEFLLSQLRLIFLLVVQGGGASDGTPMAHLLKAFLLNNHEQLCALLTAPPRGLLITSAILDLYWCAMRSSPGVTKLTSSTCVASTVLFAEGHREERPLVSFFHLLVRHLSVLISRHSLRSIENKVCPSLNHGYHIKYI